jgi:hypothetical protein
LSALVPCQSEDTPMPSSDFENARRSQMHSVLRGYASTISYQTKYLAAPTELAPNQDLVRDQLRAVEDMAVAYLSTFSDDERLWVRPMIVDSKSARLLALCPDVTNNKASLSRHTLDELHYWLKPGVLTLFYKKGISIEGMYIELLAAIGQVGTCDEEFLSLAKEGFITAGSSQVLLHNELYHMQSASHLAEIFQMIVNLNPKAAAHAMSAALFSQYQPLVLALGMSGAEISDKDLHRKLPPELTKIRDSLSSAHGRIAMQDEYGDLEDVMSSLQRDCKGKSGQMTR